jgi:hypothetical protein
MCRRDNPHPMVLSAWLLVAIAVGVLAAVIFVLGPIATHSNDSMKARPQFIPLAEHELPEFARIYIGQMIRALARLGFRAVENVRAFDMVQGAIGFQVILVHPETNDIATISATATSFSFIRSTALDFQTHFRDDTKS